MSDGWEGMQQIEDFWVRLENKASEPPLKHFMFHEDLIDILQQKVQPPPEIRSRLTLEEAATLRDTYIERLTTHLYDLDEGEDVRRAGAREKLQDILDSIYRYENIIEELSK